MPYFARKLPPLRLPSQVWQCPSLARAGSSAVTINCFLAPLHCVFFHRDSLRLRRARGVLECVRSALQEPAQPEPPCDALGGAHVRGSPSRKSRQLWNTAAIRGKDGDREAAGQHSQAQVVVRRAESGAAFYLCDRRASVWHRIDFDDEKFDGYSVSDFDQQVRDCGSWTS